MKSMSAVVLDGALQHLETALMMLAGEDPH